MADFGWSKPAFRRVPTERELWKRARAGRLTEGAKKVKRMCEELGIDCPDLFVIQRVRPSQNQRAEGAWLWFAQGLDYKEIVGSCHRLRDLKEGEVVVYHADHSTTPEIVPKDYA